MNIDWDLLSKYLADETTEAEQQQFESWLAEKSENRLFFQEQKKIWEITSVSELLVKPEVNEHAALSLLKLKQLGGSQEEQKQEESVNAKERFLLRYYKYAVIAAYVVFSVLFLLVFFQEDTSAEMIKYQNDGKEIAEITLEDGTQVWLAQGASLRYPKNVKEVKGDLVVFLTGKGYFKVAKKDEVSFKVHTDKAIVEVVGTEFAISQEDEVRVSVLEGKVRLSAKVNMNESVALNANMIGIYDSDLRIEKGIDPNDLAWKTNELSFKNETLQNVSKVLSDYYHTPITTSPENQDCEITTVIAQLPVEEALELISLTLGLEAQKTEKGFVWSGNCE